MIDLMAWIDKVKIENKFIKKKTNHYFYKIMFFRKLKSKLSIEACLLCCSIYVSILKKIKKYLLFGYES